MKLSIVIPAHNEEGCLEPTLDSIAATLGSAGIDYEVVVVDDASTDDTAKLAQACGKRDPRVRLVSTTGRHGYGIAVRTGLAEFTGDAAVVMMADGSDAATDLLAYHAKLLEGFDCVFGSRFIRGGSTVDYPIHKLVLNRMANLFIRVLFGLKYNDVTNAFKCYHRRVVESMQPLISHHFNLTVEMPLKAIVRGWSYTVVPISWANRKAGVSKLKIKEMGSRYLFIVLYLWLEKYLSLGDYQKTDVSEPAATGRK